jgi:hypothetical protein
VRKRTVQVTPAGQIGQPRATSADREAGPENSVAGWTRVAAVGAGNAVSARAFEAISFPLDRLWPFGVGEGVEPS